MFGNRGVQKGEGNLTTRMTTCQPGLLMERPEGVVPAGSRPLGELLTAAKPALSVIAGRLCATQADASDLLQDTLERATRQGIPADVRNPRAWLATIMHNLFIDRCRSVQRQPPHEPLDENHSEVTSIDTVEEPSWVRATIEDVRSALQQIDPTFAQVYRLHSFEHHSYEQIAATLKIERVTVGTRLNRARKMLRKILVLRLGLEEVP
jgi:RNA polymerase sigma-70 factor, ECF subfamily